MYSSVTLRIFSLFCNRVLDFFIFPHSNSMPVKHRSPPFPSSPWQPPFYILLLCPRHDPCWEDGPRAKVPRGSRHSVHTPLTAQATPSCPPYMQHIFKVESMDIPAFHSQGCMSLGKSQPVSSSVKCQLTYNHGTFLSMGLDVVEHMR